MNRIVMNIVFLLKQYKYKMKNQLKQVTLQ